MDKDFKRRITHEVIILLGVLMLLFFVTRLWPLILLALIGLLFCVIRLLFLKPKAAEVVPDLPPTEPKSDIELDITRRAFGLLQRRITEELNALYPNARWVWSVPNAMAMISDGSQVYILLNRAGGYRRAEVIVSNLQFKALRFETVGTDESHTDEPDTETEENSESGETDYSLLAFEWVEENSLKLNQLCNDAIANGINTFLIPSDDLPVSESLSALCEELVRSGFIAAEITEDGIEITYSSKPAERE